MILMHGKVLDTHMEEKYLSELYSDCTKTLNKPNPITTKKVIAACHKLYEKAIAGEYNELIMPLLQMSDISYDRFLTMAKLFSMEELEYKCRIELGEDYDTLTPLKSGVKRVRFPLGILFHIAAGNVDGLPAYSVIEGLLTGNINILKLPAGDNGVSITLLSELINLEPELADYIYVFDVPSTETATLKRFAEIADGVVVWGGDEAVAASKNLTDTKTKIIPWGHKLSFAYVTEKATDEELYRLALHVCETNQVLCSSCQGIFLDTGNKESLYNFGERFFYMLKKANMEKGKADMGMRGRNTIRLYTDTLEKKRDVKILNEDGVSVVIKDDSELELSYMFRNVWVKALPQEEIIYKLKKHKNHLQTCGLLCGEQEYDTLAVLLAKAGIVRITGPDMSRMVAGEAHDGVYPLQEYSRIIEMN